MKTKLETKTSAEILESIDIQIKILEPPQVIFNLPVNWKAKRWVSLELHEAAMKEAEEIKKFAIENSLRIGRENAEDEFKALLAEQRKEIEKMFEAELDSDKTQILKLLEYEIKRELLVLLEERTR
jgi:hypothetical protein